MPCDLELYMTPPEDETYKASLQYRICFHILDTVMPKIHITFQIIYCARRTLSCILNWSPVNDYIFKILN